jgi:VCBS repeat-containing protein
VLSTKSLKFGAVKHNKSEKLSFTITNSAKTVLQGYVDASGVVGPLSVVSGAGSFTLAKNKKTKVVVEFAPTASGKFTGAITVTSGDQKHLQETISISGKSP